MRQCIRYPRTPHIKGSRFQHGDHNLEAVDFSALTGKHLVVEEKMDGANCGISFSENGELLLQSRGHYLRGGPRERHFNLLKQWAACHLEALYCALGSRYVMYGEWLYAKHTLFYDALPHYFMEFDVLDTQTAEFLDTPRRRALLAQCPVTSVLVLHEGPVADVSMLAKMITRSNFITDKRDTSLEASAKFAGVDPTECKKRTDMSPDMEGLYVKWEEDGIVKGRFKYIRQSFTNAILDQETHWHDRFIVPNVLANGAYERMFQS